MRGARTLARNIILEVNKGATIELARMVGASAVFGRVAEQVQRSLKSRAPIWDKKPGQNFPGKSPGDFRDSIKVAKDVYPNDGVMDRVVYSDYEHAHLVEFGIHNSPKGKYNQPGHFVFSSFIAGLRRAR